MNEHPNDEKSCDPQLFQGLPEEGWGIERLRKYARTEYSKIVRCEHSATARYWRLGKSLTLLRENYLRGKWGALLKDLRIDKTRASKACAIYRTFESLEAACHFTVDEAYKQRKRKRRKVTTKKKRGKKRPDFSEWLHDIGISSSDYGVEIASLESDEARSLLPLIDAVVEDLRQLRTRVEQRAG